MDIEIGSGDFVYTPVVGWGQLPNGWEFGDVADIAHDDQDRVYVFSRSEHPMVVFDRDGNFLDSWGEGVFTRPHGAFIGPDGAIYCADDGGHAVRKFTLDGKLLLTIGIPGKPSPFMSGDPFCRCTSTAIAPNGDIYVSDGYGNARIHKFTPDGKLIKSWGGPGTEDGEFIVPHHVTCDDEGWVYVADRENSRIQVFDGDGNFETKWHNLNRPNSVYMTSGPNPISYIAEAIPSHPPYYFAPNIGPRLSVMSHDGEVLARIGMTPASLETGHFLSPHGMTVDSRGDIYVGETVSEVYVKMFGEPLPNPARRLQKLAKVNKN